MVDTPREILIRKCDPLTQGGAVTTERGTEGHRPSSTAKESKEVPSPPIHPLLQALCCSNSALPPVASCCSAEIQRMHFPQSAGRTSPRGSLPHVLTQAAPRSAALLPPPCAEAKGSRTRSCSPDPYHGMGCADTPQAHVLLLQLAIPMGLFIPALKTSFGLSRESHAQQHQSSSPFTGTLLLKHFLGLMEWSRSMEEERSACRQPALLQAWKVC